MKEKTTINQSATGRRQFLKTVSLGGVAVLSVSILPKVVEKVSGWALSEPRAISAQVSIDLGYKKPRRQNTRT